MEQNNMLNEFDQVEYQSATTGQRFANYIIDTIVFYALIFIVSLALSAIGLLNTESVGLLYLVSFSILIGYYTVLEGANGKSVGKMVTKTKVLMTDGQKITYGKAFVRTLCRAVPFEPLSIFFGAGMWHDKWVDTMVVKDN